MIRTCGFLGAVLVMTVLESYAVTCAHRARMITSSFWLWPCAALVEAADDVPARPARNGVRRSITDRSIRWPARSDWQRIVTLEDYNTRVVVLGTTMLGLAAGMTGSFTLLRKRALVGDALSHATLPGIGLAFVAATLLGSDGKSLPVLLLGAAASGLVGMASIVFIRNLTRLKEDAALGIVLSVFFGAGIAVLGVVQQMKTGHAAGLESFIYGKTASMVAADAWLIGVAGVACVGLCMLLFKELKLLCFDEAFARSRGFPVVVVVLDMLLMILVVVVTIIGLQAVGLILMIALLVVPAAAARFWTDGMAQMLAIAGVLGAASGMVGSAMSAILPRLPSGAMIVLVAAALFLASMIFGPARGVLVRWLRRRRLNRKVGRQHLLRAIFERLEARNFAEADRVETAPPIPFDDVVAMRSWAPGRVWKQVRLAERERLVRSDEHRGLRLSANGFRQAAQLVHDHRLWELYLITHADIAPSNVDRDADAIEHVLDPGTIARLEALLEEEPTGVGVPVSPHPIELAASGSPAPPSVREP